MPVLQIKKREKRLLEQKIKDVDIELRSFEVSQKDVCKIDIEDL